MNKAELIKAVQDAGLSKKDATVAVNTVFDAVADALTAGDAVSILGFGTFTVKERAERQGHNPSTGDTITIAASKNVSFKAGKGLKDKVNE